jgi:Xaa-Pro aminopeptidase
MPVTESRKEMLQQALHAAGLDALICSLPANVLMTSGYWPVVGTSLAVVVRGGPIVVLAPEDERDLTPAGWMDEVRTFQPGSLEKLTNAQDALKKPLHDLGRELSLAGKRIGHETGPAYEESSYASMHLFRGGLEDLLRRTLNNPQLMPADEHVVRLRARMAPEEVNRVRKACSIAGKAFQAGARGLEAGLKETEAAALFHEPLATEGVGYEGIERAGGFTFCMSGPNSAKAYGAYARSRARRLSDGDLVLVHCNSYADGYWTDITRTYHLGRPDDRTRSLYDAVFAARQAALSAIRLGVTGAEVDRAARQVLESRGLGPHFKHSTGHGVGFAAINHNARPRLHPRSPDVLEVGMVFNVEPAVYFEGQGGLRHCDVVTVTENGPEVLTPFQASLEELALGG